MSFLNNIESQSKLHKRILSAVILAPMALWILISGGLFFKVTMSVLTVIMLYEFYTMSKNVLLTDSQKVKYASIACAMIVIPMLILIKQRTLLEDGLLLMVWLLVSVWASDIGAYFVGLKFRGPKLAPKISPNKTWSGLCGACISTIVVGYIFQFFYSEASINFGIAGLFLGLVAQAGDLFESQIKRNFNAKDSGNIIPGHGGLLDRMDSILASSYYLLLVILVS